MIHTHILKKLARNARKIWKPIPPPQDRAVALESVLSTNRLGAMTGDQTTEVAVTVEVTAEATAVRNGEETVITAKTTEATETIGQATTEEKIEGLK